MFSPSILILSLTAAPLALAQEYASTTTFEFSGSTLPTGLSASNYKVGKIPNQHEYMSNNVEVSGGFLNLKVNGGQSTDTAVCSGEVVTDFTISSASVETYAILTEVPGVVNGKLISIRLSLRISSLTHPPGIFLYSSDNQETDIEWLSSPESQSNIDRGLSQALWYTNQAVVPGTPSTHETSDAPAGAFSGVHNYRIDWNSSASTFYVDGELKYQLTENVPTARDGHWLWNNWS
jgi:beta-glucanase (GH16 family)